MTRLELGDLGELGLDDGVCFRAGERNAAGSGSQSRCERVVDCGTMGLGESRGDSEG